MIILVITLSASCKNREVITVTEKADRVRITGITEEEISIPVHSTGLLVSIEELKLSFKTGGIVENIFVKEGDRVKKGELLASLDLSEISASAEQATSGYQKALRDYNRTGNLYRDSVATLEQLQNASTALQVAKAALDIVQFNLTHSKIVAPDNGLIMKRFIRTNELIASGYPAFLFASSGKYWKVRSGVSDKDIVKINPGDSAVVVFDAYPDVNFSATVDIVGEMANPYTGTYEIEMLLDGSSFRLVSGFVAGVDIFPSLKKSFSIVPVGSIVEAKGHQGYIFVLTGNRIARKVKIDIETFAGTMAAVKGIPDEFTEVVSEGAAYLKDGTKVEVVK